VLTALPPVVTTIAALRQQIASARAQGQRVGFVPTMGALHAGHASLITAARRAHECVVVSIFVNPTQFGPTEDFSRYPRTLDADLALCAAAGATLVWTPTVEEIYPPGDQTIVDVEQLSKLLEGRHRPTHFRGVTTVVLKLLLAVVPDIAYFGQKDYQQQLLIRTMVRDLFLPVQIETCATIREDDGLALSSRNRYLSPVERESARVLSQALFFVRDRIAAGERQLEPLVKDVLARLWATPLVTPDYFTIVAAHSLEPLAVPCPNMVALVAARVGTTRLIDNCLLPVPEHSPSAHL
jgi:pantoate--beta-alanine ligase